MKTLSLFALEIIPGYDLSQAAWGLDWIVLGVIVLIAGGVFSYVFFAGWQRMTADERATFKSKRTIFKSIKDKKERKAFVAQQSNPVKTLWRWKKARVFVYPVVALLSVVALVATPILYSYGDVIFATLFYRDDLVVNETTKLAAQEATENVITIEREAIVLLKNEDNILPLDIDGDEKNVNIFGMNAYGIFYGNGGSGEFATDYTYDRGTAKERVVKCTKFEDAVIEEGFEINPYLHRLCQNYASSNRSTNYSIAESSYNIHSGISTFSGDRYLGVSRRWYPYDNEPGVAAYTKTYSELGNKSLIEYSRDYSDVAIFMISRFGTESTEMTEAQLKLMANERAVLNLLTEHFDKIILLLNTPGPVYLDEVEDFGIKAVVHVGHPGLTGTTAIAEMLSGKVNPSGRTVDTWPIDFRRNPTYETFGTMSTRFTGAKTYPFSNYYEGIYVGYRYFTTRAIVDENYHYHDEVYYSFGHGLSYTTFNPVLVRNEVNHNTGIVKAIVSVENTGPVKGKYVIELYSTPPYYHGGIEKAAFNLIAYQKTNELEPGVTETYELTFKLRDLASWDTYEGCYNLERGDYTISVKENAWDMAVDNKGNKPNFFTFNIADDIFYRTSYQTGVEYQNLFEDVEYGGNEEKLTYLSRADFEGTYTTNAQVNKVWYNHIEVNNNSDILRNRVYQDNQVPEELRIPASDYGVVLDEPITLHDMKYAEADDPRWDDFLSQLSIDDAKNLIAGGNFTTPRIDSIQKPVSSEGDGPCSCYNSGTGHPSSTMLASTWWNEAALLYGRSCTKEGAARGMVGWYAPGLNIHRSPYGGRNFEYYSEDPLITGNMGGYTARGGLEYGIYSFAKHYGLNEQEINRNGLNVFCTEQSIREIYLRGYEIYTDLGGLGMMTAFSSMGTTWAGASEALCNKLLRGEWGFKGSVITDYNNDTMPCDAGLRAGNDEWLIPGLRSAGNLNKAVNDTPNDMRYYMRVACKNILYSLAHSNAAWDDDDFIAAGIENPRSP